MATYSVITGAGTQPINYTGTDERGARFINRSGVDVTITHLGLWKKTGDTTTHTHTLYDIGGSVLGSTSINMSGQPNEAFVYGAVSATIAAGATVYLLATQSAATQPYWGPGGFTNNAADIGDLNSAQRTSGVISAPGPLTQSYGPVTFQYSAPVASWTYDAATRTFTTDGTFYQVKSALSSAVSGDTVLTGAMTATWFAGGASLTVPAGVTLSGASAATSIVNMSTGAVSGYGVASITLNEGSVVKKLKLNGPNVFNAIPFRSATNANDWRISEVDYTQYSGQQSYFIDIQYAARGLIDQCTIEGGHGQSELIYARGPTDAWNSAHTMGGADNVFVESCTFNGIGYVSDANANARMVVRFNTITNALKVDGHGVASNSPTQGVRNMEVLCNDWTYAGSSGWAAIEMRGGTFRIFGNTTNHGTNGAELYLTEYGYLGAYSGFGMVYQTPSNYPVGYQIGTGRYTTINATAVVAYQMVQIKTTSDGVGGATTSFTAMGAPNNNVGTQFIATGPGTGTGTVTTTAVTEPGYIGKNLRNGVAWEREFKAVVAGAISTYRTQTGNPSATFDDATLIQSNREFYADAGVDTNTGLTVGTAAQMAATTAVGKLNQGFWVTDEGSWNGENDTPGTPGYQKGHGQLYVSNGTSWVLNYTPYTYPHPMRGATPTASLRAGVGRRTLCGLR